MEEECSKVDKMHAHTRTPFSGLGHALCVSARFHVIGI